MNNTWICPSQIKIMIHNVFQQVHPLDFWQTATVNTFSACRTSHERLNAMLLFSNTCLCKVWVFKAYSKISGLQSVWGDISSRKEVLSMQLLQRHSHFPHWQGWDGIAVRSSSEEPDTWKCFTIESTIWFQWLSTSNKS